MSEDTTQNSLEHTNMERKPILLYKYKYQVDLLLEFQFYCEALMGHDKIRDILTITVENAKKNVLPMSPNRFKSLLELPVFRKINNMETGTTLREGLFSLNNMLLVSFHSILESYLIHVAEVFYYNFPDLIRNLNASMQYHEILQLLSNNKLLASMVEKAVDKYNRLSLKDKCSYMSSVFYIQDADNLWNADEFDWIKDIDDKRNAIVHTDKKIIIDSDYLICTTSKIKVAMVAICVIASANQGIPFLFYGIEKEYKLNDELILKPKK